LLNTQGIMNDVIEPMEPLQPLLMKATVESVAAPGAKGVQNLRAPIAVAPESKRGPIIEKAEGDLEHEMETLEEGTKVRNREFQMHLDAIKERGRAWEAKMKYEDEDRARADKTLRTYYISELDRAYAEMEAKVCATYDNFDNVLAPPLEDRCAALEDGFDLFADVTVPGIMEELQGTVIRKLKKQREVFEIDNVKLDKRERKIKKRNVDYEEATTEAFVNEKNMRFRKFLLMQEEMDEAARNDDRNEEKKVCEVIEELGQVQRLLAAENKMRETEDVEILMNLAASMKRLQESILVNFGMEGENQQKK